MVKISVNVVLLAYKEAENLKVLLPKIRRELDKENESYEIIVIDTEQPLDNTQEICDEFGARYVNQRYPHFGGAFRTGIEEAEMEAFLILDSDGSHDPKYIPDMLKAYKNGADLVIGSRYVKGGTTMDSPISVAMSKILNGIFRPIIGLNVSDVSTDFRIYHTAWLKEITLSCENYDILEEVLLKLHIRHPKLVAKEIPISFQKRMYGDSKRQLIKFIISYMKTLVRLIHLKINAGKEKGKQGS